MLDQQPSAKPRRNVWRYLGRAMKLRCPLCGISPLFLPWRRVEDLTDWFDTLDGCPRCNYPYHREPGYFLFALWFINFWIVAIFGVIEVLALGFVFNLSTPLMIFITLIAMWALGTLSVRHTKSFFLALDHLVHPLPDPPDS